MTSKELYNETYNRVKAYILANSSYSPAVVKKAPQTINNNPLVVFPMSEFVFKDETLDKSEIKEANTFEINIYTQNQGGKSDITIAEELQELVLDVLYTQMGMKVVTNRAIPNLDANIYRIYMRFTCVLDKDKNLIYRI